MNQVRPSGGELVVYFPGGGEDAATPFCRTAACYETETIADSVGMEWLSTRQYSIPF